MLVPVLLAAVALPAGIVFHEGPVNTVTVGSATAVYGVPPKGNIKRVLLTHARRDAMSGHIGNGVELVVPAAERELFENPSKFWTAFETGRFHDYAQVSTKVPVAPLATARAVADGDKLEASGIHVRVIATPGYTRGAVSYLIEAGGKRIACTGDLIYGDGQLFDLYSLQDAVPEAKARGYHGYAARAGELIASLRKIQAEKPDVLLPARGPAIESPNASIEKLITRLQSFLGSHFEVDALRWYWGDENHRVRSRAVERPMEIMPMAEQAPLPGSILAIGNSRLIVSRTGAAFLVDAGYGRLLDQLKTLRSEGKIKSVDGIWITHYHDDHTDYINDVVKEFGSPVYFTQRMAEVMAQPGAFRLPCLTTRPVSIENAQRDGEKLRWHEWEFTFHYFPGQTMYHGGLVAKQDGGDTYLFAGDSFTPSGMDDYCMQNRDILRPGDGYDSCLRTIEGLPKGAWVLNQHVNPMFRYTPEQVTRMKQELVKRSATLQEMSPWPDINFMVDESWARMYPYGSETAAGGTVDLQLRIMNHAAAKTTYRVKWNVPAGWTLLGGDTSVSIDGRKEGTAKARMKAGAAGLHIVTADVSFGGKTLPQWTEAMVRVR